jgi:hypothetical protein
MILVMSPSEGDELAQEDATAPAPTGFFGVNSGRVETTLRIDEKPVGIAKITDLHQRP